MNIIKNTLKIGLKKPVTFLHITDTHLALYGADTDPARKMFCQGRRDTLAPHATEDLAFAKDYAAKTGYPLIHTGDLLDFITPENLAFAKDFAASCDLFMITGNHEQFHCPNNRFHEVDAMEEYQNRDKTLDLVQTFFPHDIRFFCKELEEVLLVGLDNSLSQIQPEHFARLRELTERGKPIILFVHVPFYTEELWEEFQGYLLAMPDACLSGASEYQLFEQKANEETLRATEWIRNCSAVRCIVSGHMHTDFESKNPHDIPQLVTGIETMREITLI